MKIIERFEDMSVRGRLQLFQQDDGDIIVGIIPPSIEEARKNFVQTVEFCTTGAGGGQSPRTLQALVKLMEAMEADNKERPQERGA